jgi:two-component system CheB/CheR fusion protein
MKFGHRPSLHSGPRVVGVGASAGGLIPLEQFLSGLPSPSGLAFVVVQHLDPTHKAMLVELLQRATPMPVREASEGAVIEPDTVYVIPPNFDLTVSRGVLHLAPPIQPRGMRLPIDLLFSSLARDQGDRAIGVLLSGMGSDGALGLQSIKAGGGLALVQQPELAQFDSMPKSAIAAGCVDIIAPAEELPLHILRMTSDTPAACGATLATDEADAGTLASIVRLMRERSKHDLSEYKPSTLRRRVQRRMGVHGLPTAAAYEAFVRQNPQELDLLFKELLIGVTCFFRDPAAWQELKDSVIPALLQRTEEGARLRAWVVGCSTGEEAYSLAMTFREVAEALPGIPRTLQIFASDLNADAIAVARKGLYAANAVAEVGVERLARFFVPQGDSYQVDKDTRAMLLFAQHDVILDPPFTRLDLLSCRNLLIYFDAALQRRLLPLFAYSLRPGGALLLGSSETVGRSQAQFKPHGPKSRLYWRNEMPADARSVNFPVSLHRLPNRAIQEPPMPQSTKAVPANLQSLAEQVLLQAFSPPAVLVNEQGDIVYVNGSVGRFLEPATGKANWNIHVMAHPSIRAAVTAALRQAALDHSSIELPGLHLGDDSQRSLNVTVRSLAEPKALKGLVMIVFLEVASQKPVKRRRKSAGSVDPALADELQSWKDEVGALRQEMGAAAEELQASNEELQSTNEELQSANEELTTSKEESQSMNEELQTLNGELQSKLDDLSLAQSDMQNLLNSTDIATLFLDGDLNVRRFTDKITRIINLREVDIGRPLSDLASTLIYPAMHDDAKETLRTLSFTEKQIATTDGLWFLVRIKPYRTLSNVIQGVVITLIDITASKELESRLRKTGSA